MHQIIDLAAAPDEGGLEHGTVNGRIYNMLTAYSFRVRLAKITYVDMSGKMDEETHFAFFIEPEDQMAERNGGESLPEDILVNSEEVDREELTRLHVFQYMIGNKDFQVKVRQNVKIVTNSKPGGLPIVVPYDFDWAGMVEASYTKLSMNESKPVYFDRREFKPICRSEEEFQAAFDQFLGIKDQVFSMYEQSPYLGKDEIKISLKYYKDFYKMVTKPKNQREVFFESCPQLKEN